MKIGRESQLLSKYRGSRPILVRDINMRQLIIYVLSHRSRKRERLHATCVSICSSVCLSVCLFVCLSPNGKNAIFSKTKQFKGYGVDWQPIGSYVIGLFREPIIGFLKSKMADIRHLENEHDVIFFCWGRFDLDKISETGAMTCRLRWYGRNRNQM